MAKKLVAVTGIKHNGEDFAAGEAIDPSKFSREELKDLHDNGALVISDDTKAEDVKVEEVTPEAPAVPDTSVAPKESAAAAPKDTTAKK